MSMMALVNRPLGLRTFRASPLKVFPQFQRLLSNTHLSKPTIKAQLIRHSTAYPKPSPLLKRSIHTSQSSLVKFKYSSNPPRFNRGPPYPFGFLFYMIPDGLKAIFLLLGVSAFVMFFMGPLLIITLPPLIIGGFFLRNFTAVKRSSDLKKRYEKLMETHLTYQGSELDELKLGQFVVDRIVQAIKTNEQGLAEKVKLFSKSGFRTHHSLDSRLGLTGIETIDQDFRVSTQLGIKEQITIISFGLLDTEQNNKRLATVIVTLRPRSVGTLLDIDELGHDVVIEVHPSSLTQSSVTLTDPSDFKEPPTITIKPNRK